MLIDFQPRRCVDVIKFSLRTSRSFKIVQALEEKMGKTHYEVINKGASSRYGFSNGFSLIVPKGKMKCCTLHFNNPEAETMSLVLSVIDNFVYTKEKDGGGLSSNLFLSYVELDLDLYTNTDSEAKMLCEYISSKTSILWKKSDTRHNAYYETHYWAKNGNVREDKRSISYRIYPKPGQDFCRIELVAQSSQAIKNLGLNFDYYTNTPSTLLNCCQRFLDKALKVDIFKKIKFVEEFNREFFIRFCTKKGKSLEEANFLANYIEGKEEPYFRRTSQDMQDRFGGLTKTDSIVEKLKPRKFGEVFKTYDLKYFLLAGSLELPDEFQEFYQERVAENKLTKDKFGTKAKSERHRSVDQNRTELEEVVVLPWFMNKKTTKRDFSGFKFT